MSAFMTRWPRAALMAGMASLLVAGCVASGGYGYDQGGLGVGYYEPYGVDYGGGWDGGYRVGPVRGRGQYGGGRPGQHAYRAAPSSRPMPSLPSRGHGGPSRGGSRGAGGGARH